MDAAAVGVDTSPGALHGTPELDVSQLAAQRARARHLWRRVRALFLSRVEDRVAESRGRLNAVRGRVVDLAATGGVRLRAELGDPEAHVTRCGRLCMPKAPMHRPR